MRALAVLAILGLVPCAAHAQNAFTLKWTPPTQYEDGTPLPANAITGYEVLSAPGCGDTATQPLSVVATVNAPERPHSLPAGSYRYAVITLARRSDGSVGRSAMSPVLCATLPLAQPEPEPEPPPPPPPPSNPNPPTDLKVVVSFNPTVPWAPAYTYNANNARSSVLAGLVPVGRPCTGPIIFTYRTLAFRQVSPVDVLWWKTAETPRIAAPCG